VTPISPVAAVRGLSKSYRNGVRALDGLNLELGAGQVTAILGPNGSGKSTLLRILAGRLSPTAGEVLLLGLDTARAPRALRSRVGYSPQEGALDPEMTGLGTLRYFAALHGLSRSAEKAGIGRLAEDLGLSPHLWRRVSSYSGGERKRLQASLALLLEPDLFLLDEPTGGIDPEGRQILWRLLQKRSSEGRSVLIVTQDMEEAEASADHVVLLDRGRLLVEGSPRDLIVKHGRERIELTLAGASTDDPRLRESLKPLGTIEALELRGRDVTIQGRGLARLSDHVFSHLEAAGLGVMGFRFREPDLASVYLRLVGRAGASAQ